MSAGDQDGLAPYKAALRERYADPETIYRAARQARRRRRALVVTVLLGLAALLIGIDPAYRSQTFETAIGEHRDWTLADGSRLSLNTGSALRADWHLRSRRLRLLHGEAAFDVAASPLRRFTVRVAELRIDDIGTVFAVREDGGRVQVQVVDGAVDITGPAARQRLDAGQGVVIRGGAFDAVQAIGTQALAWRDGRIVFDGIPLAAAAAEIARYRAAPVHVAAGAAALRISGQFDTRRLEALFDALPAILPVEVQRAGDGSIEIRARRS